MDYFSILVICLPLRQPKEDSQNHKYQLLYLFGLTAYPLKEETSLLFMLRIA